MHSVTLRFLAAQSTVPLFDRIHGGTVLQWVDEAGFACASGWAKGSCVTAFVSSASFARPVRLGDMVEVHAQLASTGRTSMHLAIEVRAGSTAAGELLPVTDCVAVYTAIDEHDVPRPVDHWTPETPGDMALAERVQAHIAAARAVV